MSWIDRLQPAAYVSPSGEQFPFEFEDVGEEWHKKTTAFQFTEGNGTYIQETGHGGRRLPLRVFKSGPDHDLWASRFAQGLRESGVGTLQHPLYGNFKVVPFGPVRRRDDLKTAANQVVFEVEFWETIDLLLPGSQQDPEASVAQASAEAAETQAQHLVEVAPLATVSQRTSFRSEVERLVDRTTALLAPIAEAEASVRRQFETVEAALREGMTGLIADPLTLAHQVGRLIRTPAQVTSILKDRLSAYAGLARDIIRLEGEGFHTRDLFASGAVSAHVDSAVNAEFDTATEALTAAEGMLDLHSELETWREEGFEAEGSIDTGESYQKLRSQVALAAGYLVYLSFSLKKESLYVTDRPRTAIDLCAELYGNVDRDLDFLIRSNQLSGSEILEIPAGRQIVYYP